MNKASLKILAGLTARSREVGREVRSHVLKKLSRQDLKKFLYFLREELRYNKVTVKLAQAPKKDIEAMFLSHFPSKDVDFAKEASIGAGYEITDGDDVIRMSVRSIIERTIGRIKQDL
ncbi:MAG: hypothetical protein JW803_00510 [Endomicrobiales bacterium]|nr:hypothetical protein [Endomicrobiales bacterium]